MWSSTGVRTESGTGRGETLMPQTTGSVRRAEVLFLLALVIVSLTLRVAVVRMDRIVRWDEPDYLIAGRNLFTGKGYAVTTRPEIHYAPLFPIVTGVLYPLTHDMKLNSDLVFVLFGTLALLPLYWLARELFGCRTATMAAAFLCCLLYTSPSPRDATLSRMPSSA